MIGIKKITKLLIAGIMFLLVIGVVANLYNNRSVFDISSWADKCFLCNFEDRHHCNPEHASAEMRTYARQLRDKLIPRLTSEPIGVWITVPLENTYEQVQELGLKVRKVYSGEIYVSCCFENRSEHFGSSNVVCHGTMEEIISWLSDDNNLEAIVMMLQDLYENTRTWD